MSMQTLRNLAVATTLSCGVLALGNVAARADELADIKKAGVLNVGVFEDFPPFSSVAADMSLHVCDVGDVPPGYWQHYKPATRLLGDQPFGAQGEQRFTHRRDTDSQLRSQLVQTNIGPRGVCAIEDPPADEARNVVGKLRPRSEIRSSHRVTPGTQRVIAC